MLLLKHVVVSLCYLFFSLDLSRREGVCSVFPSVQLRPLWRHGLGRDSIDDVLASRNPIEQLALRFVGHVQAAFLVQKKFTYLDNRQSRIA